MAITPILVGLAFQMTVEFNPTTTAALMLFNYWFPSLSLSVRLAVEVCNTITSIAMAVKVVIVISQSVVVMSQTYCCKRFYLDVVYVLHICCNSMFQNV
jgi:hypothetical protein